MIKFAKYFTIVGLLVLPSLAFAAVPFTDTFDELTFGDLSGNGIWTGSGGQFQVQSSNKGAAHVYFLKSIV
jgi:hypothetical protein